MDEDNDDDDGEYDDKESVEIIVCRYSHESNTVLEQ